MWTPHPAGSAEAYQVPLSVLAAVLAAMLPFCEQGGRAFFCKHLLGGEGSSVLHLGLFLIYITMSLSETGNPIYISEQRLSCLFSPSFSLLTSLFCNLRLSSLYLLVCKRFCPTDGTKDCFPQISVIVCQMAWQVSLPGIFLFVRTQVSVRNTYHCVRQCKCT